MSGSGCDCRPGQVDSVNPGINVGRGKGGRGSRGSLVRLSQRGQCGFAVVAGDRGRDPLDNPRPVGPQLLPIGQQEATTKIVFPALGVSAGNSVDVWTELRQQYRTRAYALLNGYWDRLTLYDSAGLAWSVAEVTPALSPVARLLARTVYNPQMMVRIAFSDARPYQFDELKNQLTDLANRDDDVLTQFIELDDLKALIRDAPSFKELLAELRRRRVVTER